MNIISGNRIHANGAPIDFVAFNIVEGEIEVDIEEEDIKSKVKLWDSALIMYVLGRDVLKFCTIA